MMNFRPWTRAEAHKLRHLKKDPLWTEEYQRQVDRRKAIERQERQARRRVLIAALLRRPRLGLVLLAAPILDRLHGKAVAIIQQAQDDEFERAYAAEAQRRAAGKKEATPC